MTRELNIFHVLGGNGGLEWLCPAPSYTWGPPLRKGVWSTGTVRLLTSADWIQILSPSPSSWGLDDRKPVAGKTTLMQEPVWYRDWGEPGRCSPLCECQSHVLMDSAASGHSGHQRRVATELSNTPSTLAGHSEPVNSLSFSDFSPILGKTVNGPARVMTPFHCSVTTLMSQLPDGI